MKKKYFKDWEDFSPQPVIGVDEVGRGCLAGPVFSATVILKRKEYYPDSKQVSFEKRQKLASAIMSEHIYSIGVAHVEEIESMNILQAAFLSMKRALSRLPISKGYVLVDGIIPIPNLSFPQTAVVKGDRIFSPIAAASIVAKVKRDEWISKMDQKYPQYGFSKHKGYGTNQHKEAILKHGPCPLHRKSFKGVREFL